MAGIPDLSLYCHYLYHPFYISEESYWHKCVTSKYLKFQVVKVRDFRSVTIDDLKHHLVPFLKKKPEHIILHVGTNDAISKTSRRILDELLQLKQYIINALLTCRVIVSRPTIRTGNGKVAVLTLSNFNKFLGQLEVDFIDNVNIKEVHLGKKGLHLNKKGKNRIELNFLQKLRNL